MPNSEKYPSYVACVTQALSSSPAPLSIDELLVQVEGQRPVSKDARRAIYRALSKLYQAIPVAPGCYGWLSSLLNDTFFRHPLSHEESSRGFLLLDELEHAVFFPQFFQSHRPDSRSLTIQLFGGPTIRSEPYIERKTWSLSLGTEFVEWIHELGGQGRDDIIIRVDDAVSGHYTIRLQPREARDNMTIQNRNIQMALLAEELVMEDKRMREAMPAWELAGRLIGRGFFADSTPPDELHYVMDRHSLLSFKNGSGYTIDTQANDFSSHSRNASRSVQTNRVTSQPHGIQVHNSSHDRRSDFADFNEDDFDDDQLEQHLDALAAILAGADLNEVEFPEELLEDSCEEYEGYLDHFYQAGRRDVPVSHDDFHMLLIELEMLVSIEIEFGRLLADQQARLEILSNLLLVDPETLKSSWDVPFPPDFEDPPFWEN